MNKKTFTMFSILFFSFVFSATSLYCESDFGMMGLAFENMENGGRPEIERLSKELLENKLVQVEQAIGTLEDRPTIFDVNTEYWRFYSQGPKVLRLLGLLHQYKEFKVCEECINAIDRILYLQIYEFIMMKLDIDKEIEVAYQRQTKLSGVHFEKDIKTILLEIFFKIYNCKNLRPSLTFLIIKIFMMRSTNLLWSKDQKMRFLVYSLDEARQQFFTKLDIAESGVSASNLPKHKDIDFLIDVLKRTAIAPRKDIPWKLIFKWIAITGSVAVGVVGAYVVGAKIFREVGKLITTKVNPGVQKAAENFGTAFGRDGFKEIGNKIDGFTAAVGKLGDHGVFGDEAVADLADAIGDAGEGLRDGLIGFNPVGLNAYGAESARRIVPGRMRRRRKRHRAAAEEPDMVLPGEEDESSTFVEYVTRLEAERNELRLRVASQAMVDDEIVNPLGSSEEVGRQQSSVGVAGVIIGGLRHRLGRLVSGRQCGNELA